MMRGKTSTFNKLNTRILLALLALFIAIAGVVSVANNRNIRNLYEESYTERLLLANALMGTLIDSHDIEYFVDLMKNQDDDFKRRQVDFYHDREELFELQREDAPEQEQQALMDRLAAFHNETRSLKSQAYWDTLADLKQLKQISRSTYVYVMANTGLVSRDGEMLFTYIFDAEDEGEYSSPDMDGLGTSDTGNEAFTNVFLTKKQTEKAEHYEGDFGELYFVCTPILNAAGDVVAILGTDLSLDDMNSAIALSESLFNNIIFAIFIASVAVSFVLLSRSVARPIGSLTQTALTFAEGNLHASISKSALKQRTEIGTLAHAIKNTLDATTLYLNSVPETLFIMNRECDTLFRNEQFIRRFGDMRAREFVGALFPSDRARLLDESLRHEGDPITAWIEGSCFAVMLKQIALQEMSENSILVIANDITDLMREKENAQAAATAKSNFLSRMSHEMRTPMNAILGMAKVAGDSDSISNIRHCVSAIDTSSQQLLNIINDVLDMSKIEAGKLSLENAPMNVENMLMKVCGVVAESMRKKNQHFNVVLSKGLKLHYIADEPRLSQVLTNLLSNAVKFTPEGGTITLTLENTQIRDDSAVLRVAVSDTGIGLAEAQIARLFNAFEQADGSIARKFGGTGLGLAISQSIVEMMGGHIEVESRLGAGATFSFSVELECAPHRDALDLDGVRPEDVWLLIIEGDDEIRNHFLDIIGRFGLSAHAAATAAQARALLTSARDANRAYDVIFVNHEMPDANGIDIIKQYADRIDKDSVVVVTSYLEWPRIEKHAHELGITRCIAKPIFPSSVLGAVSDVVGCSLKAQDAEAGLETPDLTGVRILLAEDIDINQEVFLALMEGTNISTDIAENGLVAVSKFTENPDLYDMIIMDIQMPEMDGYEATRVIRAMDMPQAKCIPIVAMSANAFKEDIERSLESGMNDHLAKPIDVQAVIKTILRYLDASETQV